MNTSKSKALATKTYDVVRYYSPEHGGHKRVIKRGLSLKDAQANANAHGAEHSKGRFFHGYTDSKNKP